MFILSKNLTMLQNCKSDKEENSNDVGINDLGNDWVFKMRLRYGQERWIFCFKSGSQGS